jgi:hypothetical protein
MAAPGDNMEEEMMNIINNGTQFIANADEQDVDDGSRYLALENEQENTGEVYIVNILYVNIVYIYIFEYLSSLLCTQDIYLLFFLYSPLDRQPQRQRAEMFEARKNHWRGGT